MATRIQATQHGNNDRNQRWTRLERAELFVRSGALPIQGVSQRQAATVLDVPRSTLPAWLAYHDRLAACPAVVAFCHSVPGLAFLPQLVMALHLGYGELGACGIRLVCLLLTLTGLNRFVGASYGTQHRVNRHVEEAMVAYRQEESTRLAHEMPPKERTMTRDETFTGGLCWVGMDPESNDMVWEHTAPARDQDPWEALMAPALAELNCKVMQAPRDEAPGLLAYVAHPLGAHHSPDLFHVQHELSQAVSAPMAAQQRAAAKAITTAEETLKQGQAHPQSPNAPLERRGPGRPPKVAPSLEKAVQEVEAAHQESQRLTPWREQVGQGIRAIGHAYHFVDLERGVRRHGKLIASDIQEHIATIRTMAPQEQLSETGLERSAKAERVGPTMQATIAFVSGDVRQQVHQLDLAQPVSYAMHAHLMPSYDLDRVASPRPVTQGEPLRTLAERLRTPLFESGGALGALRPMEQNPLKHKAKTLAEVFQRSSAHVEGRNG